MNEQFEKLEAELAAMRPAALRDQTVGEIERQLGLPLKRQARMAWGDRVLITAMSIGSLAACVIVAMLLLQSPSEHSPNQTVAKVTPASPRMGDASMLLARAETRP